MLVVRRSEESRRIVSPGDDRVKEGETMEPQQTTSGFFCSATKRWDGRTVSEDERRREVHSFLCFLFLLCIVFSPIPLLAAHQDADLRAVRTIRLSGFSPDNQQLLFDYCPVAKKCVIAIWKFRTQELSIIEPTASDELWTSPSFSSSGEQIVFVARNITNGPRTSQIGIIDMGSRTFRMVTKSDSFKEFPSFSLNSRSILFAKAHRERKEGKTRFVDWDIYEIDVSSGIEKRLTEFCFFLVNRPYYVADGPSFIFSGDPTCNIPLQDESTGFLAYQKRFSENTIFIRDGKRKELSPVIINEKYSDAPSISKDGKRILYVVRTNDLDQVKGLFNYDLFLFENGVSRRLTKLNSVLYGNVLSPDGTLAAFISDPDRKKENQVWMLNIDRNTYEKVEPWNAKRINRILINQQQ